MRALIAHLWIADNTWSLQMIDDVIEYPPPPDPVSPPDPPPDFIKEDKPIDPRIDRKDMIFCENYRRWILGF